MDIGMESYQTKLVGLNLLTLMATMKACCKKQEYELKEKELDLLSKLLNSLTEKLKNEKQSSPSHEENNPYANFIMNYVFRKINHPLDLLEGNFLFSLVPAIEFIIALSDINIKEPLLDQKIQELFYQIKNQSKEMIARYNNENNRNDYTSYNLYSLIISNQTQLPIIMKEIITFYHSLDKEEQSKTPLIGMVNLSNLDND